MSRKNPVPEREQEICRRLMEIRAAAKLSRSAFAEYLGIKGTRLASYELGRVPVRFDVALKAAAIGGVSLWWLAEGIEPKAWGTHIPKEFRDKIPNRLVFSEAYDKWLKPVLDEQYATTSELTGGRFAPASPDELEDFDASSTILFISSEVLANSFANILLHSAKSLPQHLYRLLWKDLCQTLRLVIHKNRSEIDEWNSMVQKRRKNPLTETSLKGKTQDVKSEIQKLIEQVRRKASKPGAKAELARTLDVAPARISEWLSGEKEPGGDYALRLQKWVRSPTHQ